MKWGVKPRVKPKIVWEEEVVKPIRVIRVRRSSASVCPHEKPDSEHKSTKCYVSFSPGSVSTLFR